MKQNDFRKICKFLIFIAVVTIKPSIFTKESSLNLQCLDGSVCILFNDKVTL